MPEPAVQAQRDPASEPVGVDGRSRRKTLLVAATLILAGVANNANSLRWGFQYDDYIHQLALRQLLPTVHLRCWNLYNFGTVPESSEPLARQGLYPWWTDADFRVRFFRPVSSLSIYLDFLLYRDWAPGYHITSLLWFAVFLTLSFRLYRDLGASPSAALWALAFLALEDGNFMPVGWIANRNTLLAAVFTVATVLAVHRHRLTSKPVYFAIALVCFLLGCGSKESGTVAFPLIALYLILFDPTFTGLSHRQAFVRLLTSRTLWAFGLVAVAYVGFYAAAGYGARSELYSTPWVDPAGYLRRLGGVVPLGLLSLFFGFSTDLLLTSPQLIWPIAGVAVLVLTAVGVVLFRVVRWQPLPVFALGWMLCVLLPEAGTDLSDRLFMSASVGSALLMGLFLNRIGPLRRCLAQRQYSRAALGGLFVLLGLVVSVPSTMIRSAGWYRLASFDRTIALNADLNRPPAPPNTALLLNSPSIMVWSMLPTWAAAYGDLATRIFPLQFGRRAMAWTRDDERTMTLTYEGPPLLTSHFERLFRTHKGPPPVGTRYETSEFTVTALAVEPTGIRTIRLDFKRSLDDPPYRFLAWQNGRLSRIAPPPVGQTTKIPAVERVYRFAP